MLRKRSRPVTSSSSSKNTNSSNPTPAAPDHHNTTNFTENNNNINFLSPTSHLPPESKKSIKLLPTSLFFFNSSKLFGNFFFTNSNSISAAETEPKIMNHPPTSRFDTQKPLFAPSSPLGPAPILTDNTKQHHQQLKISSANTKHKQNHHHFWEKSNSEKGIGLVALIDETLNNNNNNNNNHPNSTNSSSSSDCSKQQQKTKLVVFGSQLQIQIPPCLPQFLPSTPSPTTTTPPSSSSCCNSPGEFGIKTPRSNLFTNSLQQQQNHLDDEELMRADSISIEDIELSEDYTCVITHGPNPRTTRIFGNCILESCCEENGSGVCSRKKEGYEEEHGFSNWSEKMMESEKKKVEVAESFLSFCHYCKKKIGEGNDIYMYRGEKAFCSQECRCQGMLFEEVEA